MFRWVSFIGRPGATLDGVALAFDRRRADPGYGYVGVSRCRSAASLFLVGRVRRTDWRPVGGDADAEQVHPSSLSGDTDSEEPNTSDMDQCSSDTSERDRDDRSDSAESAFLFQQQDSDDEDRCAGWEPGNEEAYADTKGLFDNE